MVEGNKGHHTLLIRGLIKGLSTNYGIYCTFSLKMYPYIVHDSNKWYEKYSESVFRFQHLLIRGFLVLFDTISKFSWNIYPRVHCILCLVWYAIEKNALVTWLKLNFIWSKSLHNGMAFKFLLGYYFPVSWFICIIYWQIHRYWSLPEPDSPTPS